MVPVMAALPVVTPTLGDSQNLLEFVLVKRIDVQNPAFLAEQKRSEAEVKMCVAEERALQLQRQNKAIETAKEQAQQEATRTKVKLAEERKSAQDAKTEQIRHQKEIEKEAQKTKKLLHSINSQRERDKLQPEVEAEKKSLPATLDRASIREEPHNGHLIDGHGPQTHGADEALVIEKAFQEYQEATRPSEQHGHSKIGLVLQYCSEQHYGDIQCTQHTVPGRFYCARPGEPVN